MLRKFLYLIVLFTSVRLLAAADAKVEEQDAKNFRAFTGQIERNNVRMRIDSDLISKVVKTFNSGDMVIVVGERDEFYKVKPPRNMKAYIYKSYVIDNMVVRDKVNLRLKPDMDATVIAQLNSGDKLQGVTLAADSPQWLELDFPEHVSFYIAKDYIKNIGDVEVMQKAAQKLAEINKNLQQVDQLMESEFKKPFDQAEFSKIESLLRGVMEQASQFPLEYRLAKQKLEDFEKKFLKEKVTFLEGKSGSVVVPKLNFETSVSVVNASEVKTPEEKAAEIKPTLEPGKRPEEAALIDDKMQLWFPIESDLYQAWSKDNPDKTVEDFYQEQKISAKRLKGSIKEYESSAKNKPGSFILYDDNSIPIGFLYSTIVPLQKYLNRKLSLLVKTRNNNNFALPAYYVLEVQTEAPENFSAQPK